jgi:hypothetical protein
VEGAHARTGYDDVAEHGIHILQHVACRDPEDAEAFTAKEFIASGVAVCPVNETVRLAVHFDDQPMLEAGKVGCDLTDGELTPELQSTRLLAKHLPK